MVHIRYIVFTIVSLFVLSCAESKKEASVVSSNDASEGFDMYEPSEMANYMNTMYAMNEQLKYKIEAGKDLGEFPEDVLQIHTAIMSDFKARNETFERYSKLFVEQEQSIFDSLSTVPIKQRYNDAINLCISCHKTECTGPIPRIKKLLIK